MEIRTHRTEEIKEVAKLSIYIGNEEVRLTVDNEGCLCVNSTNTDKEMVLKPSSGNEFKVMFV